MGHSESNPMREIHSNVGLPTETNKKSKTVLTSCLRELGNEQQTKPKVNMRKQIRSEQKLKTNKIIQKIK